MRLDSSDTVSLSRSVCGTPETPKERGPQSAYFPGWGGKSVCSGPTSQHLGKDGKLRTECVLKLSLWEGRGQGGKPLRG